MMERMTSPSPVQRAVDRSGKVWIVGGSLVIAATALPVVAQAGMTSIPLQWVGVVLFAGALTLFALGFRGDGSITRGHPSGTISLLVLAGWLIVARIVGPIVWSSGGIEAARLFAYVNLFIQLAAGIIAVVAIGRARAVPAPWHWAPAWALAARAAAGVVTQLPAQPGDIASTDLLAAISSVDSLMGFVCPLFLGVLAVTLGIVSRRDRAVRIYSGSDQQTAPRP